MKILGSLQAELNYITLKVKSLAKVTYLYFLKLFLSLFILHLATLAHAQQNQPELNYNVSASGSHYPFYTGNPEKPGILPEIITALMAQANITANHVELPTKRITKYLENGIIDFDVISLKWLAQSERDNPYYIFSEPLIPATEMIVALPDNVAQYQTKQSLYSKEVGTVLGYYYHDDAKFNRVDFPSEKELMIALSKARIDVAIMGIHTAAYWSKQLNINTEFGAQHSHGYLRVRLLAKHKALLPKINQALAHLHSSGYIKRIEDKYINSIPAQNLRD